MVDNWAYSTVPGYPYCGFGIDLGYHSGEKIIIENLEVRGTKQFPEVDFSAYFANLGLSYNETALSSTHYDVNERIHCAAVFFKFVNSQAQLIMTNIT